MGVTQAIQSILRWLAERKSHQRKAQLGKRVQEETQDRKNDLTKTEQIQEVLSVWDVLSFKENTQAAHLNATLGFDEWVDMGEIRRRVMELFRIEYKNERSLYPYIKTLVDIGLLESTDIGGKRKWRKKGLLVKVAHKAETEKRQVAQKQETSSTTKENEKKD